MSYHRAKIQQSICVDKVSTRFPYKNGSPPYGGRDSGLKTTEVEKILWSNNELSMYY